jgi:Putative zinc-finger
MKCEHAKDFFSEYIEQSLDKPTGVALEAHLTACGACQRELDGLRQTWGALNATPAVEPPADLAWRVMCRLQEEKLQRLEAEQTRKAKNPFLGWLQALTPGAAFGYATLTALLIIGMLFPLRSALQGGVIFGPGIGTPRPAVTAVDLHPLADLAGARQDGQGRWIMPLVVTTAPQLGQSSATVTPMLRRDREWVAMESAETTQVLPPGATRTFAVPMTVEGERVLAVRVRVQAARQTFQDVVLAGPVR